MKHKYNTKLKWNEEELSLIGIKPEHGDHESYIATTKNNEIYLVSLLQNSNYAK